MLQKLKADVESYLEEPVTETLIPISAFFTNVQRQAKKDLRTIAELDVFRIINIYFDARHLSKYPTGFFKKPNKTLNQPR